MRTGRKTSRIGISTLGVLLLMALATPLTAWPDDMTPRTQVYPAPGGVFLTPLNFLQQLQQDSALAAPEPSSEPYEEAFGITPTTLLMDVSKSQVAKSKPKAQQALPKAPPQPEPKTESAEPTVEPRIESKVEPKTTPATAEQPSTAAPTQPSLPAMQPEPAESAAQTQAPEGESKTKTPRQAVRFEVPALITNTLDTLVSKKPVLPVSYSPLEAVVVFPVIKTGQEKAFSDLPVLFAREFALKLETTAPQTKVYNPIYTVDELRLRGLGHVYDQMMGYYLKAGRPEPTATDYLLKRLSDGGKSIARIIFVEADLDMNHMEAQSNWFERINGLLTDATPKQIKGFVNSRIQVFDAENPALPMVWGQSWRRSIKANQYANVTPSVFQDSDSQQAFSRLSRDMSRELLWVAPKSIYMAPQYDLSVLGRLAKKDAEATDTVNGQPPLTETHKQAIQRILQQDNTVKP